MDLGSTLIVLERKSQLSRKKLSRWKGRFFLISKLIIIFQRTIFEIKNILLIEFWPELANLLGMSEINQGFEKVRFKKQRQSILGSICPTNNQKAERALRKI